jgi:hypothetical protein
MLDVHPPEHAAHTWRDFFIHIATIVVGLLIAVGLEQSVELSHRRHLLHQADHNLQVEFDENRATLAKDERQLAQQTAHLSAILDAVDALRKHQPIPRLSASWDWDDLVSAAWDTTRNNGITVLMSYPDAQNAADRYRQQDLVNAQAGVYVSDIYRLTAPLQGRKSLEQLTPPQLDRLELDTEQALADIAHLTDLCHSMDEMNRHAALPHN